MNKKNILLSAACIVLVVICGLCTFFINQLNSKQDEIKSTQPVTQATTAAEIEKTYMSTEDEIIELKSQIAEYEYENKQDEENNSKQAAVDFVNIRYNYDGTLKDNKERILKDLVDYVDKDYMYQVNQDMMGSAGNMGATDKQKKKDDYCQLSDVYYTYETYSTGERCNMMIVECHTSTDETVYREISVIKTEDGKYVVNNDKFDVRVSED